MREQGIEPAGPLFSYHLKMPSDVFEMEIGFPVDDDVKPSGRVVASALPALRVARTIYRGPMEGLGAAWGELKEWVGGERADDQAVHLGDLPGRPRRHARSGRPGRPN